ncbi:PD-(D/E)XK nuclease family transposase [Marinisporobacter balticus]|uniref:Putative transposase/invertase (TIGR01784 family) n=1 Tax=Marinisporobacter balticus TaxID=2018667 RepID=A0A4R2KA83_9FIRM|nr:PD-(D/E)XK nuclease family transposase [Marinisporobacter balticus]TCO69072.1 putative transposase/invertase (TIGR01784 family) [Marinisporobacter balticus]
MLIPYNPFLIKKCVVVNLLDFKLLDETQKYHTIFRIKEMEENFELLEDLEIHYLECPKFAEQNTHKTDIENGMAFMKAAGDKTKRKQLEKIRKP